MIEKNWEENLDFKKARESSGRVVDLKKKKEEEREKILLERETVKETASIKRNRGFSKKENKNIDFLGKYQNDEKVVSETEFLSEFAPKKKNIILTIASFLLKALKFWWIPLFLVKFIFLLIWRGFNLIVFGKRTWEDKIQLKIIEDSGESRIKKAKPQEKLLIKKKKKSIFLRLKQFIWLILVKIIDFFKGEGGEDYLCQQALFEEVMKKRFHPLKHAVAFVVLAAVLALPFKVFCDYSLADLGNLRGQVLGISERAIDSLSSAASSVSELNMGEASYNFFLARDGFREAQDNLEEINGFLFVLAKFIPDNEVRLAGASKEILRAGELASNLGRNLSLAFDSFSKDGEEKKISERLENFIEYIDGAREDAQGLNAELEKINTEVLPAEYREQFVLLKEKVLDLKNILNEIGQVAERLNVFLGAESDKRYLFVFQNNNEMRASGGFIGSFALVDFSQGEIKNVEVPEGGSYDTEGDLSRFVVAPEPLHLVDPLWHFWDANWWPDWEKSAKKLMWFYGKSGGPSVDGVISFTPTVLGRFLRITGPIDMTETYGIVMNADNFWDNIREIIDKEKHDSNLSYEEAEKKPKKIIGELLGRILKELPNKMDRETFIELLVNLDSSLSEKHILFYFTDDALQAEVEKRNWAGKIKETNRDYLAVINTNIAGGKSDKRMKEKITHRANIRPDGSVVDTLTIERSHTGDISEPFYGVRNVNWMRIYVPEGSQLLSASGFRGPDPIYFEYSEEGWEKDQDVLAEEEGAVIDRENNNTKIYIEDGKTVFANWSMVDPGQSVVIKLQYLLPFKLKKTEEKIEENEMKEIFNKFFKVEQKDLFAYSFLVQKQSGSRFTTIESSLSLPSDLSVLWKYPEGLDLEESGWDIREKLDVDKYWAVVLEKIEQ